MRISFAISALFAFLDAILDADARVRDDEVHAARVLHERVGALLHEVGVHDVTGVDDGARALLFELALQLLEELGATGDEPDRGTRRGVVASEGLTDARGSPRDEHACHARRLSQVPCPRARPKDQLRTAPSPSSPRARACSRGHPR
jgi:hypothetical protein